jgi:hypothetical protein
MTVTPMVRVSGEEAIVGDAGPGYGNAGGRRRSGGEIEQLLRL